MGIASLFFFKLFTYFWLHLGLQCHTDFLQLWQAETTRCRVRMGIASLFKKKKKTRIYLFFAAFGSSVPSPSSLLLQSNQKRWPHSFSVFFFFFLTSALFLIFTWTSFSNTSTTYLLLSSGFAPTTLLPVQSFILEENFGLFTSRF